MLRTALFELRFSRLQELLVSLGEPSYRATQLYDAVLRHGATDFSTITTLSAASRTKLSAAFSLQHAKIAHESHATDGVIKLLVELGAAPVAEDVGSFSASALGIVAKSCGSKEQEGSAIIARRVEAVLIPEGRRSTLCVSSQVGCSLACSFCHTGTQAMRGNVSASEIIGQVLLAQAKRPVTNVVFMGQGEPLLNWRNVSRAISVLTEKKGLAFPPRRVLISTAGVAPLIHKVATETPGVRLALSLHAPNDILRSRLMGVNVRWPIADVMAACREFVKLRLAAAAAVKNDNEDDDENGDDEMDEMGDEPRGQQYNGTRRVRVSFEYVLLAGVNDSLREAAQLAALLNNWMPRARLHAHINLIPFNKWEGGVYNAPTAHAVSAFASLLKYEGFATTVRRQRGDDVSGACGQLKSSVERKKIVM
jgi:23S rRNA (adenine2503-C2)-methyltransferase